MFFEFIAVILPVVVAVYWVFSSAVASAPAGVSLQSEAIRISSVSAVCNGADGSITVKWSHPRPSPSVTRYEICYEKRLEYDTPQTKSVGFLQRSCTLTRTSDGIEPLNSYNIRIRPISSISLDTEWESTRVFVDWYCQYPGCMKNRRRRRDENSYSKFCSIGHAEKFNSSYCLFPECTEKCQKYFCIKHHRQAVTKGICGFVKLDSASKEYSKLKSKFSSSWCSKKGRLPKICHIVQIINPLVQNRFAKYVKSLSWSYQIVEQYYHGTQLKCEMLEYYEPCTATCGVCGIAKTGFDPERISSNRWQRFGKGFYFAPNSSKSYDYPLSGRQNDSVDASSPYRCILVCDIAVGHKYTLYYNDPNIEGPPSGYHSIYGKSSWMWFWTSPDLNYDELVIFEANAIRPSYILFCENTTQ